LPLKSKSQLAWLKANRPDLVEEFLKSTKNVEELPDKVGDTKPVRYSGRKDSSKGKTKSKKGKKA